MYFTAHRVIYFSTDEEGVNAFYHTRGERWVGVEADPADEPNTLVAEERDLSQAANRICSHLDILAQDACPPRKSIANSENFIMGAVSEEFPCVRRGKVSAIRMGVERSLAASWSADVQRLFYESLHVWMGPSPAQLRADDSSVNV